MKQMKGRSPETELFCVKQKGAEQSRGGEEGVGRSGIAWGRKGVLIRALLCAGLFGMIVGPTFLSAGHPPGERAETSEIREVIETFRQSGDRHDIAMATAALHADFALYYKGPDGWVRSDRAGYIGALEAKAIGGEKRTMQVDRIEVSGPVASAHVRFLSKTATFDQQINLIETDEGWQIVGIVLNYIPLS